MKLRTSIRLAAGIVPAMALCIVLGGCGDDEPEMPQPPPAQPDQNMTDPITPDDIPGQPGQPQ
ncbi:MAG: hypothetical protein EA377_06270 [Phycisphaerales bacterium]|nr:MAG: hypothetical protein EA377_06270 [Phycisphaerales bacterium]